MQTADPAVLARERHLDGSEHREQQREDEIDPGKPGDECGDEHQHLESVDGPACRLVGVECALSCTKDVGADQVDLHEHADDDREREAEVHRARAHADSVERPRCARPPLRGELDRGGGVAHAACSCTASTGLSSGSGVGCV